MSNNNSEKSSIPTESQSVPSHSLPTRNTTTAEDIQRLGDLKFESTGKGLTYKDLLKPKYKHANTEKEGQRILKYHYNSGNLHPSITRTLPQQYFSSKQDAQLAHMNNVREKCNIPTQPMGVRDGTALLLPCNDNETIILDLEQEEISKADTLTRAILNATSGTVPTGMHDIHIHVNLPPQYANEVYSERLAAVPPQKTKQKAKLVNGRIDGYDVTCLFYPISPKAIITIPCSDKPYPISPYPDDSVLTSEFNDFVAQIRYFLCSRLSDYRGGIVPPIHSSRWRFIQADINWDTPISPQEYRIMPNIQLKTWNNGVRLQLYKKRIKSGLYYARAEERFHQFSNNNKTASFDANIGSTIKDAVKSVQKELAGMSNTK